VCRGLTSERGGSRVRGVANGGPSLAFNDPTLIGIDPVHDDILRDTPVPVLAQSHPSTTPQPPQREKRCSASPRKLHHSASWPVYSWPRSLPHNGTFHVQSPSDESKGMSQDVPQHRNRLKRTSPQTILGQRLFTRPFIVVMICKCNTRLVSPYGLLWLESL